MKTFFSATALAVAFSFEGAHANHVPGHVGDHHFEDLFVPVSDTVWLNTPKFPGCWQLTQNEQYEEGAIWVEDPIDLTAPFQIEASLYLGTRDDIAQGADGIAYVLQTQGNNVVTYTNKKGEKKGYYGLPNAIAIEFDTWKNKKENDNDELRIIWTKNGVAKTTDLTSDQILATYNFNTHELEDGKFHHMEIKWDGTTLEVYEHHVLRISLVLPQPLSYYLGGNSIGYYGFTAATGREYNEHTVCPHIHCEACGDPHFKTWAGEKYDFHGVCDLVLLENAKLENGVSLDIHIRTKRTRVWSFISAAAVQIGNDVLEVEGGAGENLFYVNKVRGSEDEPISLSGYSVTFEEINSKSRRFIIDLGEAGRIELRTWNAMVSVAVNGLDNKPWSNSLGLMGTYPFGQKVGRDSLTNFDDANAFGQEWQVGPNDAKLFHEVDGPQHPQQCEIPASTEMRRRLGESSITKVDAEIACSRVDPDSFDLCVFDVMATNDKDSAGAY